MITKKVLNVISLRISFSLCVRILCIKKPVIISLRIYIRGKGPVNHHNKCIRNGCRLKDSSKNKCTITLRKILHILESVMTVSKKDKYLCG